MEKSLLLGLGFDCKDGHKRITKGRNFYILGGSNKTHKKLQGKVLEFNSELKKRRKNLNKIGKDEFYDIATKIGLKSPEE